MKKEIKKETLINRLEKLQKSVNSIMMLDGVSSDSAFYAFLLCAHTNLGSAVIHADEFVEDVV